MEMFQSRRPDRFWVVSRPFECGNQLMHALRRQVKGEQLDRDEVFAFRIVSAKDRSQRPGADLMKHTKWTERIGWHGAGSFSGQRVLL